ncbi:hypothetical protein GCM10012275_63950 [Longimycelium tulufanense]|uniref:Ribonuclease VapC n=1 Tax=Longimycelium tulufanense TaxID=907463 RepID=A0A8J3CF01_9PSEU|nr:PIN domain-containing protein [Longimycelium tulufanense]GGM84457.1 hypothetical protein GCM10012275_63950 [Longimycelium tulufanense]
MIYLDATALAKLVRPTDETAALAAHLQLTTDPLATSDLAVVELHTALAHTGADPIERDAADALLAGLLVLPVGPVMPAAARRAAADLRTVDALHLAVVNQIPGAVTEIITYDPVLTTAAERAGLRVTAPT